MAEGTTLAEEYLRLKSECSMCEKCGHVQAEPNWCHRCGHRTAWPEWAKAHRPDEAFRRELAEDAVRGFIFEQNGFIGTGQLDKFVAEVVQIVWDHYEMEAR